jgi:transmembrane sensor
VLFAVGVSVWMIGRPNAVIVASADIVSWEAPDGSTVTLRPHSRLIRLDDERAYRLEGEAFFDVVHHPDAPFTVEAGPAEVRVLGTQFVVSTWGERTEVFVEEGRVRVSADAAAVELAVGEAAAASETGVTALPTVNAEAFLDWQRGELVFERTPLRRVADEIGQQFGIVVAVPPTMASETVSGVIELESTEQVLGDLGRILGGRFEPTGDGYRFVRP